MKKIINANSNLIKNSIKENKNVTKQCILSEVEHFQKIAGLLNENELDKNSNLEEQKSLFTFGKYKNSGVSIDKKRNLINIYQKYDTGVHSIVVDYNDIHKLGEFLKNMDIPDRTPPSKINNLQRYAQGLEPL
jgi:hypothetical protein